jgi:hypothetical protein
MRGRFTYPSTLMVILSLKMDQYPFRPWDDEFSSNKVLVYHMYYNMLNITVVATPTTPYWWE